MRVSDSISFFKNGKRELKRGKRKRNHSKKKLFERIYGESRL